jgi:protein SCO1/2
MSSSKLFIGILPFCLLMLMGCSVKSDKTFTRPGDEAGNAQSFHATGMVLELKADGRTVVIRHEAISNYMAAMTMPFKVKDPNELAGLRRGDEISFRLHVAATESWVNHITKTGAGSLAPATPPTPAPAAPKAASILEYKFTNELGQPVSLNDFRGQALAITFFYTRCPLPDFCPRLSKNFEEAQQMLESRLDAPTNWHLISVSFDAEFDTPQVLEAYGNSYRYNPKRWTFLTGPADKISELARQAGVTYRYDGDTINHDFRTLIIDTAGHLQMVFPTSGNLSDQIVAELIKAAAVTSASAPPMAHNQSP